MPGGAGERVEKAGKGVGEGRQNAKMSHKFVEYAQITRRIFVKNRHEKF